MSSPDAAPDPDESRPADPPGSRRRRRLQVRAVTGTGFALAGILFATSALDARGSDLRAASVTDLSTLVKGQRQDTDALQQRVVSLNREVNDLSRTVGDSQTDRLQRRIDRLQDPAGLTPVEGAGVVVTLDDAPEDLQNKAVAEGDPPADRLVVHQQDIQAVVNALWLGGAKAVSLMGQRLISTTGIKCAGPIVILHGVPYPPPYVIKAIGDPYALTRALDDSDYIESIRTDVVKYGIGYAAVTETDLAIPAYDGTTDLRYAKALPPSTE